MVLVDREKAVGNLTPLHVVGSQLAFREMRTSRRRSSVREVLSNVVDLHRIGGEHRWGVREQIGRCWLGLEHLGLTVRELDTSPDQSDFLALSARIRQVRTIWSACFHNLFGYVTRSSGASERMNRGRRPLAPPCSKRVCDPRRPRSRGWCPSGPLLQRVCQLRADESGSQTPPSKREGALTRAHTAAPCGQTPRPPCSKRVCDPRRQRSRGRGTSEPMATRAHGCRNIWGTVARDPASIAV